MVSEEDVIKFNEEVIKEKEQEQEMPLTPKQRRAFAIEILRDSYEYANENLSDFVDTNKVRG